MLYKFNLLQQACRCSHSINSQICLVMEGNIVIKNGYEAVSFYFFAYALVLSFFTETNVMCCYFMSTYNWSKRELTHSFVWRVTGTSTSSHVFSCCLSKLAVGSPMLGFGLMFLAINRK